jgi:hypothetical protein
MQIDLRSADSTVTKTILITMNSMVQAISVCE